MQIASFHNLPLALSVNMAPIANGAALASYQEAVLQLGALLSQEVALCRGQDNSQGMEDTASR